MGYTAKTVVFDILDNWGYSTLTGLRRVEFYLSGVMITYSSSWDCRATTTNSSVSAAMAFNTSLSKSGHYAGTSWLSSYKNEDYQRLLCVFDSAITFDEIVINNFHSGGDDLTRGAKPVKIYITPDTVTNTTYGAAVPNSTLIYDDDFPQHAAVDGADDQTITLISMEETGLVDMALDIDLAASTTDDFVLDLYTAQFFRDDSKLDVSAFFQNLENCPFDLYTLQDFTKSLNLDLFSGLSDLQDLQLDIIASIQGLKDFFLDIYLTNGFVKSDICMDISVGDGNETQNMSLDLMTVYTMPEFKSVYAMNLSSIIKEITA